MYFVEVRPQPAVGRVLLDVAPAVVGVRLEERHRQVAGQDVIERGNIGRALNRRMSAQRQDAAARASDVAEQQLQNRGRANDLHALRVLRPAHRVADGRRSSPGRKRCRTSPPPSGIASAERRSVARPSPACSARSAVFKTWKTQRGCCSVGSASYVGHLRGFAAAIFAVAAVGVCMTGRVSVADAIFLLRALVQPGLGVVLLLLLVPSGEDAVQILGIAEVLANDRRGVGVVLRRTRGTTCRSPGRS